MAAGQPRIASVVLSGTKLILSGTSGVTNEPYEILSSTNLAVPLIQWAPVLTNEFDSNGSFTVTNIINPNTPQNFYILQVP